MNISGTSSYIRVRFDDNHEIVIDGELVRGGFIAEKDSINQWEPPFENEDLNDAKKNELVKKIEDETKGTHMVITFE